MSRIILSIVAFFILSQIIGIYAGIVVLNDLHFNPYVNMLVVTTDSANPANAIFFMLYVVLGAFVMIVLIRKFMLNLIFRVMEFILLSTASSIIFYSFLRIFYCIVNSIIYNADKFLQICPGYEISMAGGIFLGLLLASIKLLNPAFKNLAAILATGGVGVIFGISLTPLPALIFLVLLSLYDYIAVFKTKHMIEFAEFIVKKDLAFTVTSKAVVEGKERRLDLGTGDLIAPIILEVSTLAYLPGATLFVFLGAVFSLIVFLLLVWKRKVVLPALPPLVFGMLLFMVIGKLLGFY